ncbi:ArnT family glycosyltransferase [Rubinisphaera margarita]|uniref:ArnT family glycosyltransferase n=1 Tax=Rubinisphaera margarita TaxID=2909586 RepID=UPI001EE906A7|nr:hypothetical protein [Rubinisphaera margarita]MCG6156066.1 hypothetical protein [Rubinisphaera margarita]
MPSPQQSLFLQRSVYLLLLIAFALRMAMILLRFDELQQDRDLYLGLAEKIWQGAGFLNPFTDEPTAFRPPMYVFLVALFRGIAGDWGLALLHGAAGMVTVWATCRCGFEMSLRWGAIAAGTIVALDPLLIRYSSLAMTEVVFTALLSLTMLCWFYSRRSFGLTVLTGLSFGVSALCRPTIWPMLLVIPVLAALGRLLWKAGRQEDLEFASWKFLLGHLFVVGLTAFLVVLPWGLRNQLVLGQFKMTTTHGGYTLLLGNNSTFYEAVVQKPLGTTWGDYPVEDPRSQTQWYGRLTQELNDQGLTGEFERDKAQYDLAFQEISENPGVFLQSCLLRQLRLWSPVPQGEEANALPGVVFFGLWMFYGTLYVLAIAGITISLRLKREPWPLIWLLAMIITLAVVHTFYWSNARMRAPLIPALALLAGVTVDLVVCRLNRRAKAKSTPV